MDTPNLPSLFSIEVIETIVVLILLIILRLLTRSAISRALKRFNFNFARRRMIVKLVNFFVGMLAFLVISAIWGIRQEDLFVFVSSLMTVLGIAFFAQWSLLSNISAGLILFFNHPMKIGDVISVQEKDYSLEGRVKDIGYYFVHIETPDGQHLTIPNNVLLQKNVAVK